MKLFYISSLENLNNILSLEYIVPPKIFEESYNYTITKHDIEKEFTTLYKTLPPITKDEFIVELFLDEKDTINLTENIIITPYIIPLKTKKIIFKNEELKRIHMGRSLLVSEIKNTEYYIDIFISIDKVEKNLINVDSVPIKSTNRKNVLLDFQSKKIILYDKLLGSLYYCSYMNNSSLVVGKNIYENYSKKTYLDKLKDQLESNDLLLKNTKAGLTKDISNLGLKLLKDIKSKKSSLIKLSKDFRLSLNKNHKFNVKDEDAFILNIIINNLLEEEYDIEEKMKNIGESIKKIRAIDKKSIEEYRIIYDICINGNLSHDIKAIETEILKCFLISVLKRDSLKEAKELARTHNIENNIYIYFFIGLIKGYSNMSKIIKRDVDLDNIAKALILREFEEIQNFLESSYKRELYKEIIYLKKSDNVFKIRNKNIYGEQLPMKLKSRTKEDLSFIFDIDKYIYNVTLYKYSIKSYSEEIKKLNIKTNTSGTYKSFRIKKQGKNKGKSSEKLSELDYYKLYEVLNEFKKEN